MRTAIWQTVALLVLAVVPAVSMAWLRPAAETTSARAMTLAQVNATAVSEPVLWVDARPLAAYTERHIPGAVWLAEEAWEEGLPNFVQAWTPGQPVVVYCGSSRCGASHSVAQRLTRELNTSRIFYLQGGWDAWLAETK